MRNITMFLIAALFVFAFLCPVEASEPLDQFAMKDQVKWNCAKSILIKLFPVSGKFKGKKDQNYYQKLFADQLADKLRRIDGIEKVIVDSGKEETAADIVIDGTFKDLTTGSRALRFWVSFGAGKSFCRADMKALDTKTGTEVFSLDHARGSAMDVISDDELIENIFEVVDDVAATLKANKGTCPGVVDKSLVMKNMTTSH